MGDFDDILERGSRRRFDSEGGASAPAGEPINIMALLEGDDSPFAGLLGGMNPEMKSKVIIPLAGLLDKYGLGESLGASPAATGAVGLMSVIGDIAPVIRGLAEFVSGQKNGLAADDKRFLEEIMKAESNSDFSDLFSDMGETVEEPVAPAKRSHPLLGEMPEIDTSQGPVDWMAVLDPNGTHAQESERKAMNLDDYAKLMPKTNPFAGEKKISMPSLEDLAAEAGISMTDLQSQDSNIRPEDEPVVDIESESFESDLVDSIMDTDSVDDIFYLSDEEYQQMVEEGLELEEIDDGE